jgi:methylmalonyl-CoA mutase
MIDLLRERGGAHIKVFGGGGGVIVPAEIKDLHDYGVARIFSPEDGQKMGLVGMIEYMIQACDSDLSVHAPTSLEALTEGDIVAGAPPPAPPNPPPLKTAKPARL